MIKFVYETLSLRKQCDKRINKAQRQCKFISFIYTQAVAASCLRKLSALSGLYLGHAQANWVWLLARQLSDPVLPSSGPSLQSIYIQRSKVQTHSTQCFKILIFFPTVTPIDIRPSPYVAHTRHASACKISPPYVAPFRRR